MLIITHNDIFHADEVFAIASLIKWNEILQTEVFSQCPIEDIEGVIDIVRTRDSSIINKAQNSNSVYVIDCGAKLDPNNLNFDHHQSQGLEASNMQVFRHLWAADGLISDELVSAMMPFMEGISNFDTNKDNTNLEWANYNTEHKFRNLSNIISGFNRDPRDEELQNKQFKLAVEYAIQVLDNEEYSALQRINAKAIYENREVLANNVAIFDEFCPIWKTQEDHNFAILPNPQGWSLNSANSNTHPLPTIEHEDLIFAHKGLFIAVFKSKEAALEIANSL